MSWSSLREEGLLVSLEGEGGELVPYSSLQECAIWFENGEPCHTLFCLFNASICVCKLCLPLSPAAPCQGLLQVCLLPLVSQLERLCRPQNCPIMCRDVVPPSSSSAAGCLPPCLIPGDC
ncbi:hypothetical protein Q8A73_021020 [Channa argus]|nr:hypothetical protein Q8A73_021020 [Channa argus]